MLGLEGRGDITIIVYLGSSKLGFGQKKEKKKKLACDIIDQKVDRTPQ